MKLLIQFSFFITLTLCSLTSVFAQQSADKTIVIEQTIAKETPPGTTVGAGYMKVTNTSKQDDILLGATGDLAGVVQIHNMTMKNDVMTMKEIEGGLTVPAGESVILQSGAMHLMFMNLANQLIAGEQHTVELNFANAGTIEVVFLVEKQSNATEHHGGHHHEDHGKEKNDEKEHKHHH